MFGPKNQLKLEFFKALRMALLVAIVAGSNVARAQEFDEYGNPIVGKSNKPIPPRPKEKPRSASENMGFGIGQIGAEAAAVEWYKEKLRRARENGEPLPRIGGVRPDLDLEDSTPSPRGTVRQSGSGNSVTRQPIMTGPGLNYRAATGPAFPPAMLARLEKPMHELRAETEALSRTYRGVDSKSTAYFEGLANTAVLSRVIKSVYDLAAQKRWRTRDDFQIFPIENLMESYPDGFGVANFSLEGVRIAVFSIKESNKKQRAVLLTSSFRSSGSDEIRSLFKSGAVSGMIESSTPNMAAYAEELMKRLNSGDKRQSQYLPVNASAEAWVVGCETQMAQRFCVNARVFDAYDTDPSVFYDALLGIQESNRLITEIRRQNLRWPIEDSFITRGYRGSVHDDHLGLDLAATIGTPVRAVADGVVLHRKSFSGWGRAVVIEHVLPSGAKYLSLYAHLSAGRKAGNKKFPQRPGDQLVVGDRVKAGEIIAYSGNSGTSVGPHLHLEIREVIEGKEPLQKPRTVAERPIDPLRVLNVFNAIAEPSLPPAPVSARR